MTWEIRVGAHDGRQFIEDQQIVGEDDRSERKITSLVVRDSDKDQGWPAVWINAREPVFDCVVTIGDTVRAAVPPSSPEVEKCYRSHAGRAGGEALI